MKFRNYCVVIMGKTENVDLEITKIAETEPNILDANGIVLATFTSALEPRELTDYFKENKRNFLVFDMNPEFSGYHIMKKEINDGLFGFVKNEDVLKEKMDDLMQEISSSTVTSKVQEKKISKGETKISIKDIDNMTLNEKNDLMNKILKKDGKNLSDYDKEILNKLSV